MSSSRLDLFSEPQLRISISFLEISTWTSERTFSSMLYQDHCFVVFLFSVNGIVIYSVTQTRNLESSFTPLSITLIIPYSSYFPRILNLSTSLHLHFPLFGPCYQLFAPGILQRHILPCSIHSCLLSSIIYSTDGVLVLSQI